MYMLVALIAIEQTAEKLERVFKKVHDGVVLHTYTTIEQFIRQSGSQSLVFDRVLMVSTSLIDADRDEKRFAELNRYLMDKTPRTMLLFLTRYSNAEDLQDKDIRDLFFSVFTSVLYIDISVDRTTEQLLKDLVTLDVDALRKKYSIKPQDELDLIDDFIEVDEAEVEEEKATVNEAVMGITRYGVQAGLFKRKKQQGVWKQNANTNAQLLKTLKDR